MPRIEKEQKYTQEQLDKIFEQIDSCDCPRCRGFNALAELTSTLEACMESMPMPLTMSRELSMDLVILNLAGDRLGELMCLKENGIWQVVKPLIKRK